MPNTAGSPTPRRAAAGLSLLLAAVATSALAAPGEEGRRVALIIGNDAYSIGPLRNAVNDARAMDKALRAAGFQTTLLENASKEQMDDALGAFADLLGPEHNALFYYAGHAFQIENENFLVPVDFKPARGITQAKNRCFSMSMLIEQLKRARAKTRVIILDACRGNPLAETYSLTAGLAQPLNAGNESYIAFSTGPNQVATDNLEGVNSWFTEALADLISQPGPSLDIDEIFNRVRKRVQEETSGRQTPWSQSSLTAGFYFRPRAAAEVASDPTLAQKWLEDARRREQREDWAEAIDLLGRVLQRKPGGATEAAATSRLPYLAARRDAQAAYDASDFAKAAELSHQALRIDAFSTDAAFQAANSYLLTDRLPEAVGVLRDIRVRGSSESIRKADAMLKELAPVSPEAQQELKAGLPAPPRVEEVFASLRFGVPDWEAGRRYRQGAPVELTRWVDELQAAAQPVVLSVSGAAPTATAPATPAIPPAAPAAAPAAPATPPAAPTTPPTTPPAPPAASPAPPAAPLTTEPFRVEVVALGGTRELDYGAVADAQEPVPGGVAAPRPPAGRPSPAPRERKAPPSFGFVQFEGPVEDSTLLVNGRPAPQQAPGRVQLPAGSYEIRVVRGDKVIDRQNVEVRPSVVTRIVVKR
jgi:tetratricopeptide (TPR) repeat protein